MQKTMMQTFAEITKPLKEEAKKSGMKEVDVEDIVDGFRKSKR